MSAAMQHPMFPRLLREYRTQQRLSQSRLAEMAGFDHSYISRLESKGRVPSRDAVTLISNALNLAPNEEDALLASAGFMPLQPESMFADEPAILDAYALLRDPDIAHEVRENVRQQIALLVELADRAA